MNRWLLILFLVVFVGGASVYAYLGGFKQPEVALTTVPQPIYLAGQHFKGRADSPEFGPMFRQAQQVKSSGQLHGDLGNIYYNDPDAASDSLKAFIGLVVADTTSQKLPVGFHYTAFFTQQQVVRARIEASYMVAPGKLYEGVKEYAKRHNLKLLQVYLERFPDTGANEVIAVVGR
ncbi:hypothetical protein [Hymenobacter sp. BT491]|uniref:hypothetical protein n=1 Tax=Hymenobacter sp. BT491 TaxID=2766779 RepID=UPI001653622D|nr:hypothetical protein [Hymenobacter sp. BT491]MBC6991694.1 hypothetical protein [Hymenobacter sp. BT491]